MAKRKTEFKCTVVRTYEKDPTDVFLDAFIAWLNYQAGENIYRRTPASSNIELKPTTSFSGSSKFNQLS